MYGVAFTLGSLFLVTILYTFRNLSGLTIELIAASSGFVGEDVEFQVRISRSKGKGREGINSDGSVQSRSGPSCTTRKPARFGCSCRPRRAAGSIPDAC